MHAFNRGEMFYTPHTHHATERDKMSETNAIKYASMCLCVHEFACTRFKLFSQCFKCFDKFSNYFTQINDLDVAILARNKLETKEFVTKTIIAQINFHSWFYKLDSHSLETLSIDLHRFENSNEFKISIFLEDHHHNNTKPTHLCQWIQTK